MKKLYNLNKNEVNGKTSVTLAINAGQDEGTQYNVKQNCYFILLNNCLKIYFKNKQN